MITHQPRYQKGTPKNKKMPSNEIRDAIEMNSSLRKKFSFLVLLNRYDIFAMVHERMLIQPAVQVIENLGDMIVVCATTQQRLMAKEVSRVVSPPYALVRYPPTFSVTKILRPAAIFGPVDSHQLFQQSRILLVKFQSTTSASASYGATLPGPVYFTSGSADADTSEDVCRRFQRVTFLAASRPQF